MEEKLIILAHRVRVFQKKGTLGSRLIPIAYFEKGEEVRVTEVPEPVFYNQRQYKAVSFSRKGGTLYMFSEEIENMPLFLKKAWEGQGGIR